MSLLDDLIGYWKFDENTGNTTEDEIGTTDFDVSNYSWITGLIGSAVDTNGATNSTLDTTIDFFGSAWTITAWIKHSSTNLIRPFSNGDSDEVIRLESNDSGQGSFRLSNFGSQRFAVGSSGTRNGVGDWVFVALRNDGSNNISLLYGDSGGWQGQLNSASAGTNRGGKISFQAKFATDSFGIDEATLYDVSKSDEDIEALFDKQLDGLSYPFSADVARRPLSFGSGL